MPNEEPVVADGSVGVAPEIVTESTAGVETAAEESQSYHSYSSPDGRSWDFKTADDANKYLRQGTMRYDDYTKQSNQLTQDRNALSEREKAIEAGAQTLLTRQQEYQTKFGEVEKVLQAMPRDQYERLRQQVQNGGRAEPQVPDEVMSRLQKLEELANDGQEARQQADQNRRREEVVAALTGEYEDYDADGTEALLQELYQAPDGDALRSLYDLAHWAGKGRQGVAGMQAQAANRGAVRTGKQAPVKSPKGRAKGDSEMIVHKNFQEADEAARAES